MSRAAAHAVALALTLLIAGSAGADDAPRALVRARVEPPGPIAAGQTVRLVVDAMVTTWLTQGLELPPLELPGVVITQSREQSPHVTESIDGTTYFGVSGVYLLTPTRPGSLAIPGLTLTLHPGQAKAPVTLTTAPLTVSVVAAARPPGAEHAVVTRKLTLTQHLDRKLAGLRVGDSVERTITLGGDGARAMLLPPVAFAKIDGLAVYPAAPHVDDVTDDRGTFTGGRRIDAATYVIQTPGRHTLPAIAVQWWDPATQKLATASAPAIELDAAPGPAAGPELPLPTDDEADALTRRWAAWRRPLLVALAALAVMTLAWLLAPTVTAIRRRMLAARAARQERWEASEPWAFARVTESVRGADPAAVYPALLRWLDRVAAEESSVTLATLGTRAGDPELTRQLAALGAALYGQGTAAPWAPDDLARRLGEARRRVVEHPRHAPVELPPLNP